MAADLASERFEVAALRLALAPLEVAWPLFMQRYGMVIGLRPEKVEAYRKLHAAVWPGVLEMIRACKIRNYSIYLHALTKNQYVLFGYFEYIGRNFAADMAKMAADPTTQEWWKHCKPCQKPLRNRAPGEWWATMQEVFHLD